MKYINIKELTKGLSFFKEDIKTQEEVQSNPVDDTTEASNQDNTNSHEEVQSNPVDNTTETPNHDNTSNHEEEVQTTPLDNTTEAPNQLLLNYFRNDSILSNIESASSMGKNISSIYIKGNTLYFEKVHPAYKVLDSLNITLPNYLNLNEAKFSNKLLIQGGSLNKFLTPEYEAYFDKVNTSITGIKVKDNKVIFITSDGQRIYDENIKGDIDSIESKADFEGENIAIQEISVLSTNQINEIAQQIYSYLQSKGVLSTLHNAINLPKDYSIKLSLGKIVKEKVKESAIKTFREKSNLIADNSIKDIKSTPAQISLNIEILPSRNPSQTYVLSTNILKSIAETLIKDLKGITCTTTVNNKNIKSNVLFGVGDYFKVTSKNGLKGYITIKIVKSTDKLSLNLPLGKSIGKVVKSPIKLAGKVINSTAKATGNLAKGVAKGVVKGSKAISKIRPSNNTNTVRL